MPNPKTFDYLQFWTRNNVALNVPVLDHTGLKKKKKDNCQFKRYTEDMYHSRDNTPSSQI